MTRTLALEHLRVALLLGDKQKAVRVYIENRISRKVYNAYWCKYYRESQG